MKRVIVTGANGFVGRNTLQPLIERGFEVHAVDLCQPAERYPDVKWHSTNLLDLSAVSNLMEKVRPTHLLHFAWYSEPGKYWDSTHNFSWLEASINLIKSFHENGGKRVVVAGTCAEYDWDYGYCSEALTPCNPRSAYGVCKRALQQVLHSYCAETGLIGAWGRIFFLYGHGEHPRRFVASVITSLLNCETAKCTHGNQIRDFLHVNDVASAFVALLASDVSGVVNISSGQPVTLKSVAMEISRQIAGNTGVEFGALSPPVYDPKMVVGNSGRLNDEVLWLPRYSLEQGIADTIIYWKRELGFIV